MGKNSGKGGSNDGNSSTIYDNNGAIDYRGSWDLNSFTTPGNSQTQTSHSTAENTSSIFLSFNGSQIQVRGMIPPGQGSLSANYTIDNGEPQTKQIPSLNQAIPLYYQMLYVSPVLPLDQHNITIDVVETGIDRNYTFQVFTVSGDKDDDAMQTKDSDDKHNNHHGSKAAAIVGGILGSAIFLLIAFLVAFFFWRKKRFARMRQTGQGRLPPMMYYARPLSDGSQGEKTMYMLEPASIIDTDSKFTFAVRRDAVDESRKSWVSANLPPTVPDSALVNGQRISDWSSYKGSSVIVQQSHPGASRFSPYTSMTLSPMSFRQQTPPPVPNRTTGAPSQIEILASSSSSSSPSPRQRHMF